MSKKLAIKGHPTRGKEVIELLEMMGGKISNECTYESGFDIDYFFFICEEEKNLIDGISYKDNEGLSNYICFTLEEFLEKYPFKVSDKVMDDYVFGDPLTIKSMSWSKELKTVLYTFEESDVVLAAKDLKPIDAEFLVDRKKSERTHEDVIFDSIIWHLRNSVNNGKQNLSGGECEEYFREVVKKNNENKMKNVLAELLEYIKTTPKEDLEREFEEIAEWSNVGPTVEEFRTFCECVNKKPVYPTTFEECLNILYCKSVLRTIIGHKAELLLNLEKLLICRDAYWQIAGEEMGLSKPWTPDYSNSLQIKYGISYFNGKIITSLSTLDNIPFAFPTKEMRDAFYENFKDLIESCKELL